MLTALHAGVSPKPLGIRRYPTSETSFISNESNFRDTGTEMFQSPANLKQRVAIPWFRFSKNVVGFRLSRTVWSRIREGFFSRPGRLLGETAIHSSGKQDCEPDGSQNNPYRIQLMQIETCV
jgi:hypothetical protein